MSKKTSGQRTVLSKQQILDTLEVIGGDGHSILAPAAFADCLPPTLLKRLTYKHKSDRRDPKSTIFKDGQIVDQLEGVYTLTVLEAIASILDVKYMDAFGRGTRARNIDSAIRAEVATWPDGALDKPELLFK